MMNISIRNSNVNINQIDLVLTKLLAAERFEKWSVTALDLIDAIEEMDEIDPVPKVFQFETPEGPEIVFQFIIGDMKSLKALILKCSNQGEDGKAVAKAFQDAWVEE